MKDISEYYVGEIANAEEEAWRNEGTHLELSMIVVPILHMNKVENVLEVGCGSGWLARWIPDSFNYTGVDNNATFLEWAREKNPGKMFYQANLRTLTPNPAHDLVMTFAVLKHFGLHEWGAILEQVLTLAPRAIFDMQTLDHDTDNGTDFHHSFVTEKRVHESVTRAGHRIVDQILTWHGETPVGYCNAYIFETTRG